MLLIITTTPLKRLGEIRTSVRKVFITLLVDYLIDNRKMVDHMIRVEPCRGYTVYSRGFLTLWTTENLELSFESRHDPKERPHPSTHPWHSFQFQCPGKPSLTALG